MGCTIRRAMTLICGAAIVACAEGAGPTAPLPPQSSPSALELPVLGEFLPGIPVLDPFAEPLDGGGVGDAARGSGQDIVDQEGNRRTFAFTAKRQADGSSQGQFQVNNRSSGVKEHGAVTCVRVEGNVAWIDGVVTHTNGRRLGATVVWKVIDNGEGSGSPPDMITSAVEPMVPRRECSEDPAARTPQMIEDGNIQVKDGGVTVQ